jgi:uncharacterized protein (DUF1330 family)
MPAAYIVVSSSVTDPATFAGYVAAAPAVVAQFGGTYLARGGSMEVLEGGWSPARLTVLHFPSYDVAKAMYDSPEYVAVRALRHGAVAYFDMVLVEGVAD